MLILIQNVHLELLLVKSIAQKATVLLHEDFARRAVTIMILSLYFIKTTPA